MERLIHAFGSPNTIYGTEICNWHKDHATAFTFGCATPAPDFAEAGCILLWGHNPSTSWLSHAVEAVAARRGGAKLVVVDPRRVGLANKADQWLRVRPGTDGALALGLAHVLIRETLFDRDFIANWSNGPFLVHPESGRFVTAAELSPDGAATQLVAWDDAEDRAALYDCRKGRFLADYEDPALFGAIELETLGGPLVCKPAFQLYAELTARYHPKRVAEITGVPAEQIVETARLIAANRPLAYYGWSGIGQHSNATQTDRAIALLSALTGSHDVPGGNVVFAKVPVNDVSGSEFVTSDQRAKTLGVAQRPLGPIANGWVTARDVYAAIESGEPYPIEGLVCFGSNLLASQPDTARARKALSRLSFHLHADIVLNQTAVFADIVLPVCTAWEREALRVGFGVSQQAESLVQLRAPAVEPAGESRSDHWIVFELAKRLGLAERFFGGDIDAGLRHLLQPSGVTLEALRRQPEGVAVPLTTRFRKYGDEVEGAPRGFATPTRRVEIYSEQLLAVGQAPLPVYHEPATSPVSRPDLVERYPLVLTSAKLPTFCHSQFRGIPALRRRAPDPELEISPRAAAARGIVAGDWLIVTTPEGTLRARARLNAQIADNVVCGQHGWVQSISEQDTANCSTLASTNYNAIIGTADSDPISGSIPLRSYLCDVVKAETAVQETP